MILRVPAEPSGPLSDAWRHRVGTGRIELALRRDHQDSLRPLQREINFRHIRGHGLLSDGMGGVHRPYESPEGGEDDRAALDLTPARHEVTLVEVSPVVEEAPEWWDERRLPGREPR